MISQSLLYMKKPHILIAEDERDLAGILGDTLTTLDFEVTLAADGTAALAEYAAERPDLLVTDVMMPQVDGFALIETLRKTDARLPIIVLTARTDTDDVVRGLQLGANDYLRKPFSMRELVARIQNLLRQFPPQCTEEEGKCGCETDGNEDSTNKSGNSVRSNGNCVEEFSPNLGDESEMSSKMLRCGQTMLFPSRSLLRAADGRELPLTQREVEILRRLFAQPNEIVERHQLLLDLWGSDTPYNARSLHVFISHLRTKLAADAQLSLRNVHGVGYRLVVEEK